ncbi:3-hydroxyisobutyrate dehydrogenase [Actinocorallia herbida]|uniref:3-hydroxyisobutyrate dehydrogenase n=1 Tax=Actinocorallia herbida TaxID=58109 RepID=A0A3N1D0Y2_9ACTN|nr:NAD(P)-binding domain-containing protein [Actinocorallia herbida]ROO86718.1 3-hydroxyisobutyrate dehydrogenase [Actinocorallia herbida]
MPDIAIYGLGEMGAEIARCLVRRGSALAAYDPVADPEIVSPGFRCGGSVGEVAATAPAHLVVVKRLPDLEALLFADDGLGARAMPGSLIVLHTTVTPQLVLDLRRRVADRYGHTLVDAALSRRDGKISEGSLSLLVGGTDADLAVSRPVLETYADNVVHVGAPGAGMAAKLCNNWLLYSNRHAALQALEAGRSMGLDVDVLRGALAASTGSSWALLHYSDLDAAILDGRGAPAVVRDRTAAELGMVREMTTAAGAVPTTLEETFALLDTMRPAEATAEVGLSGRG